MQGRRIPYVEGALCEPGDYFQDADGYWRGQTPNKLYVFLRDHHVEEHEDGTISVLPVPESSNSILATRNGAKPKQWHGYIRRGVWEEC